MKSFFLIVSMLLIGGVTAAQQAHVVGFKHTLRWLDESGFPNYFIDRLTLDAIESDISAALESKMGVSEVAFPETVDYQIIGGFGKPKNKPVTGPVPAGISVEIFSVLTRATVGFAVFWSVEVLVKDNGRVVQQKEAKCEIENANIAGYFNSVRWMSPVEFRRIFTGLFRDALGTGESLGAKVVVGSLEEKEQEVRKWFPNSTKYVLKTNGAMQSGGNFSARLETGQDTVLAMNYRAKSKFFDPISGKEILANLFTDISGIGTEYTLEQQRMNSGELVFSNGQNVKIQLEWIEELTYSTTSDEVQSRITVPLIGQFAFNDQPSGEFVYETITEVIESDRTEQKLSAFSGFYTKNSFGTSVLHRIRGVWNSVEFWVEYNELFVSSEIRINNETVASMIFQNCNPENPLAYDEAKLSKNKKVILGSGTPIGKPKLDNTEKQEWYPILIKNDASQLEIEQSCALLVCLFFAMAKM